MVSDFGCPWCGDSEENLLHSLLCCHYPRLIWALSGLPYTAYNADHNCMKSWIMGLYRTLDREGFQQALLVCWFIWWARNKFLFENLNVSAIDLLERLANYEASLRKRHLGAEGLEATRQALHRIPGMPHIV
ncbi:UNVERIFIED_CONTAM: hypothetical protein Slati_3664500 [Sesamum latifolium]|uniref:Reverse transcriptase zinc-binding domain-containing protein n=1 Tax=Sesamum latifolium TaxID=2727402 RepID=A0AAW2U2N6_9LAMI